MIFGFRAKLFLNQRAEAVLELFCSETGVAPFETMFFSIHPEEIESQKHF